MCEDGSLSRLGGVGDGGDDEAVGADTIENGIRSAADDEFTDAGFGISYVPHLRCWEFLLFSPSPDGLG